MSAQEDLQKKMKQRTGNVMLFKSGTLHGVEGTKVTQMAKDGIM